MALSGWSSGGGQERLLLLGGLLDGAEDLGDFTLEDGELKIEHGTAGMEDDIDGRSKQREVFADGLAHTPLDAIAVDGLPHDFANGEADAGCCEVGRLTGMRIRFRPKGEEVAHLLRELLAARLVDALVIGVFAEPEGDGEHGGFWTSSLSCKSTVTEQTRARSSKCSLCE